MPGLITQALPTDATPSPGARPPDETTAPGTAEASGLLAQIERQIEEKLPPRLKQAYLAIVVAGRQMMFSDRTHPIMEKYMGNIKGPDDVPKIVAHGLIKMLAELHKQSQGKMSMEASAPAAVTLMTYALKYVDGQLGIPVTKSMIDETTTATITGLFALWNVKPEQIQEALQGQSGARPPGEQSPDTPVASGPEGTV
jgi:hypothetical protein